MKNIYFLIFTLIFLLPNYTFSSEDQIPTEVFGSPPLIESVKLSPTGNKIAVFATLKNGDSAILVRDLTKNEPLKLLVSSDNKYLKLLGFNWFNEEIILARAWFSANFYQTKRDNTRLLKVNVDGSGFSSLFKKKHFKKLPWLPSFQAGIVDFLPEDDDNILVEVDISNYRFPSIVKLNVKKNTISEVRKPKTDVVSWETDRSGKARIGYKYNDIKKKQRSIIFFDLEKNKWRTIWEFENFSEDEVSVLGFGEEPNKVWFSKYLDGRKAIFSADLSQVNIEPKLVYAHPTKDVEAGLRYKKGSDEPIGLYFRDDNYHLITWDKKEAKFEESIYKEFPDKEVYFGSRSKDRNKYILFVENSSTPGVFYLGNQKEGTLELIAESYPELSSLSLPGKEVVNYKARDGVNIEAFLTLPKGKKENLPTVIFPHGGPIAADESTGFDYWTSFFADRGYAVLQMNFRGSTGYGFEFMKSGLGEWGLKMQFDVEDATKWAVEEGISDPERICIVGGSYGGYAALMGVATSDLYKCAVSFAGVTDPVEIFDSSRMYSNKNQLRAMFGNDRSKLKEVSPVNLADKIKVPVLLVQGEDDSRVPLKHGQKMRDAMKKAGTDYIYIQQENSDHFLTLKANRLEFFKETEKFLKKHIGT